MKGYITWDEIELNQIIMWNDNVYYVQKFKNTWIHHHRYVVLVILSDYHYNDLDSFKICKDRFPLKGKILLERDVSRINMKE